MKSLLRLLLIVMISLGFFNVFYNTAKAFSEFREWGTLSDTEKRHKIYGDFYTFLILVKKYTKNNDSILIYDNDGDKWKTFFQSIYYLYPRRVTSTVDLKEFQNLTRSKKFEFIASYNSKIESTDYQKIASFSAKKTNFGSIHKLK